MQFNALQPPDNQFPPLPAVLCTSTSRQSVFPLCQQFNALQPADNQFSPFASSSTHFNHQTIDLSLCLQEWCRGLNQHQGGVHRRRRTDAGQPGERAEAQSDCCIWSLRVGHWGCHAPPYATLTTGHAARNTITQQVLPVTLHNTHDAAESRKSSVLIDACFQVFCES